MIKQNKIAIAFILFTIAFISAAVCEGVELNDFSIPEDSESQCESQAQNQTEIEYLKAYNESSLSSHKKLTHMHKRSNLAKLGREKVYGNISGSCEYWARIRGFKGVVTIIYKNYCDIDGWILNGECNTKANIRANGKMYGCMNVTGVQPGKVWYDNIVIKKGTSAGGTYGVQVKGGERKELEYNVLPQEVEESIDDIRAENLRD